MCYWMVDLRGDRGVSRLFVTYGVNAIAVYVGSGLLARTLMYLRVGGFSAQQLIYRSLFASWLTPQLASLGYAFAWVIGWYLVLRAMQRRGIFIKV
jgi:predicted acyltransferase